MVLTITIPDHLGKIITNYKKRTGIKKAELVRRSVEAYIRQNPILELPVEETGDPEKEF